jgi:hypothetical protein
MGQIKLASTNGNIILAPEDGAGDVNITVPRAGIEAEGTARIVKTTYHTNNTRTVLPATNSHTFWSVSFTKTHGASESYIRIHGTMYGHDNYSDFCGARCDVDGAGRNTDGDAYKGVAYSGGNDNNEGFQFNINKIVTGISSGSHTVNVGWTTRNGSSGDKWADVWNPNSSDDDRQHQSGSTLWIEEVLI